MTAAFLLIFYSRLPDIQPCFSVHLSVYLCLSSLCFLSDLMYLLFHNFKHRKVRNAKRLFSPQQKLIIEKRSQTKKRKLFSRFAAVDGCKAVGLRLLYHKIPEKSSKNAAFQRFYIRIFHCFFLVLLPLAVRFQDLPSAI